MEINHILAHSSYDFGPPVTETLSENPLQQIIETAGVLANVFRFLRRPFSYAAFVSVGASSNSGCRVWAE
jgi:hypothetical protein